MKTKNFLMLMVFVYLLSMQFIGAQTNITSNWNRIKDFRYTDITWLKAHNAFQSTHYRSKTSSIAGGKMQNLTIAQLLNEGVRVLEYDIKYTDETVGNPAFSVTALYIRHCNSTKPGVCHFAQGGPGIPIYYESDLDDSPNKIQKTGLFSEVVNFLKNNPKEIITFYLEANDSSDEKYYKLILEVFEHWFPKQIFNKNDYPNMKLNDSKTWPTLKEMKTKNARVVLIAAGNVPSKYGNRLLDYSGNVHETSAPSAHKSVEAFTNMFKLSSTNKSLVQLTFQVNDGKAIPNTDEAQTKQSNSLIGPAALLAWHKMGKKPNFLSTDFVELAIWNGLKPRDMANKLNDPDLSLTSGYLSNRSVPPAAITDVLGAGFVFANNNNGWWLPPDYKVEKINTGGDYKMYPLWVPGSIMTTSNGDLRVIENKDLVPQPGYSAKEFTLSGNNSWVYANSCNNLPPSFKKKDLLVKGNLETSGLLVSDSNGKFGNLLLDTGHPLGSSLCQVQNDNLEFLLPAQSSLELNNDKLAFLYYKDKSKVGTGNFIFEGEVTVPKHFVAGIMLRPSTQSSSKMFMLMIDENGSGRIAKRTSRHGRLSKSVALPFGSSSTTKKIRLTKNGNTLKFWIKKNAVWTLMGTETIDWSIDYLGFAAQNITGGTASSSNPIEIKNIEFAEQNLLDWSHNGSGDVYFTEEYSPKKSYNLDPTGTKAVMNTDKIPEQMNIITLPSKSNFVYNPISLPPISKTKWKNVEREEYYIYMGSTIMPAGTSGHGYHRGVQVKNKDDKYIYAFVDETGHLIYERDGKKTSTAEYFSKKQNILFVISHWSDNGVSFLVTDGTKTSKRKEFFDFGANIKLGPKIRNNYFVDPITSKVTFEDKKGFPNFPIRWASYTFDWNRIKSYPNAPTSLRASLPEKSLLSEPIIETLRIFPNPATDKVTVVSPIPIIKASVLNLSGERVHEEEFPNSNTVQLTIGQLSKGVYLLQLQLTDGSVEHRKIIKQ